MDLQYRTSLRGPLRLRKSIRRKNLRKMSRACDLLSPMAGAVSPVLDFFYACTALSHLIPPTTLQSPTTFPYCSRMRQANEWHLSLYPFLAEMEHFLCLLLTNMKQWQVSKPGSLCSFIKTNHGSDVSFQTNQLHFLPLKKRQEFTKRRLH